MLALIFLVFALVLFVIAAFNVPARFNIIAAGLACLVVAMLVPLIHGG